MAERRIINGYIVERGDDGVIRTIGPANQPAQPPADPTFQYKGSQAAADLQGRQVTTQGNALDNQITAATLPSVVRKTGAEAAAAELKLLTEGAPDGYRWKSTTDHSGVVPLEGYVKQSLSPEIRKGAIDAFNDARALEGIVSDLRSRYKEGPGSTAPWTVRALRDFNPYSDANKNFNDAGQRARGYVKRSLGFTGGEGNTLAESSALYDPYLPKASDNDSQIIAKIQALEDLGKQARDKAVNVLGGAPDERGNVIPAVPAGAQGDAGSGGGNGGDGPGSVWQQTYIQGGGGTPGAAGQGATTQQVPLPPQVQQELQAYIQQQGGNLDPAQLRSFIDGLYAKYGFAPNAGNEQWARDAANAARQGGTINANVPGPTVPLSGLDKVWNDVVSSPTGTAAANVADAGSLGLVSLLQPGKINAANEENPLSATAGQIVGAVGGTGLLGAAGRRTIGAAIPSLMGGGRGAALARGLGTDAIYSGIYGANVGDDPLLSTVVGAGGSLLGRGVGRAVGATLGGAALTPAATALRNARIPLTTGQTLGGFAKRAEDAMTSIPGVGDLINSRRLEGLRAFNNQAFNDAGLPIGATVNDVGEAGVNSLRTQMGDAYNRATAGVNVPLDAQLGTDLADVATSAGRLPPDYAAAFDTINERRVQPLLDRGQMTGADYQQAQRGLRSARRSADNVGSTGFEQEYRDALTDTMRALEGNMRRGGGTSVVEGLNAAAATRRNLGTIEDAVRRAAGGSTSGENFLFTPNQLQRAGLTTESLFPGPRPMAALADAGQEVLPSRLPDSGTARRVAQLALPASLGGAGAGLGAYSNGTEGAGSGAATGVAIGTLLALGGTRGGQRVLNGLVAGRPEAARDLGRFVSRRNRMFGAGFIPLALPLAADQ